MRTTSLPRGEVTRRILEALERNPEGLTCAELVDCVYGDDPDGGSDWAAGVVRIALSRLGRQSMLHAETRPTLYRAGRPPPKRTAA